MLLKTGLISTLCLLSLQSPIRAQELPPGQRMNLGTKAAPDIRQCYDFDEYKGILQYQIDCSACKESNGILKQQVAAQEEIIGKQDQIMKLKDDNIVVMQSEKDRLYKMWSEENAARHKAEDKPIFGNWIGWTTAAVLGVATVFLTGLVIAK